MVGSRISDQMMPMDVREQITGTKNTVRMALVNQLRRESSTARNRPTATCRGTSMSTNFSVLPKEFHTR